MLSFEEGMPERYPEHLEAGTLNGHGIAGLSAAVAFIAEQGKIPSAHDLSLTKRFVAQIHRIPGWCSMATTLMTLRFLTVPNQVVTTLPL